MPADMLAYSGLYGSVGKTANVEIKNGQLELPALYGGIIPAQHYVYTGNGQFKNKEGNLTVSFDRAKNGKTYLKLNAYLNFPGLGQILMVTYEFQKFDPNPLKRTVKSVWEQRNGKHYYALDEKITSVFYMNQSYLTKEIAVDTGHGYASGTKIVNGSTAVNAAAIPVMSGRDAFDLVFHKKNHKEYLATGGQTYISEDAVQSFSQGSSATRTIPSSGQAVWYKIDKQSAGRVLTVQAPASGGFAVYDAQGTVVNFSKVSGKDSAVLPEGGMTVFGGSKGDVFKISLKN